ncbi:MAG: formylglycine-generating enzyme family protein, partial [Janthinobacterium lividum]
MTTLQMRATAATLTQPELARQLAAAMKRGTSALIATPAATLALLDEAAALLAASRTRVLHVRPPYNLTSFMHQIAPSASEEDGSLLDSAYDALTVLDPSCDRIALLAESAHLMPKVTLRYIESLACKRPYLCVALAGKPELAEALASDELSDLRHELSLHLALSGSAAAAPVPAPAPAPVASPSRRPWIVAGFFGAVCIGLIVSHLLNTLRPDGRGPAALQAADAPAAAPARMVQDVPPPVPLPAVPEMAAAPDAAPPEPKVAAAPPAVAPELPAAASPAVAAATPAAAPPDAIAPPAAPAAAFVQPVAAQAAVAPAFLEPAMLTLPGGEFRMGSNDDLSERPPHTAVLAPFLLAEHAVTVREWQQCQDAKACPAVAKGKPGEPVTNVSWEDARLFAAWLSRTTGQPYRLPTEAEWEYAARAGANTRYAWGNAMMPGRAACKGCGEAASLPQSPPRVDAYPPNAFGLYGMGGGAKEWVADCWHRNYQGAPRNGSIPWE